MPKVYVEGERFKRDNATGYCQACEDPDHEDGTPPVGIVVVGPIFQQVSLVLCEGCLRRLANVAATIAGASDGTTAHA
jgi:hypothetical protein